MIRPRAVACILVVLAACSPAAPRARITATPTPHKKTSTPPISRSHTATAALPNLPYVVERAAGAVVGGTGYMLGGLVAGDRSISPILSIDLSSGLARRVGTLPAPAHDAAAAALGNIVFIFGGSGAAGNLVQRFDPATGSVTRVGTLPRTLSDLGAVAIGSTIYVVGGFDAQHARREILSTTDGRTFTVAAMLPYGLRYMAVAAAGSKLLIVGGQTDSSLASRDVFLADPASGSVRLLGLLPLANAHAVAVVRADIAFVIGGRDDAGRPTDRVWRISLPGGSIAAAAPLSIPLADATLLAGPDRTIVAGGATGSAAQGGETNKEILFTQG